MHAVCMCRANAMRMRTMAPVICTSLCVVVECTCRRIIRIAPFWEPVIRYEVAAARKHLLKYLSIVVGFFSAGNDTTEL